MSQEHHEFDSPVDLPGSTFVGGRPLLWTSVAIAVAALFLLLTNALALRQWVEEWTPGPLQMALAEKAQAWEAFTDSLGLGTTRAAVHDRWKSLQAARFERTENGGEASAQPVE